MARLDIRRIKDRCVPDGDCLVWAGKVHTQKGSPVSQEFVDGKDRYVSPRRRAYEEYHGVKLGARELVTCSCGNVLCLSRKHLVLITPSDRSRSSRANMTAAARLLFTRRAAEAQQARCGKFTPEIVKTIRESEKGPYVIARELGVSGRVASRIKRGISWRDHQAETMFSGLVAAERRAA